MNIIDILIVLLILLTGVVGLKRGFFKEIIILFGWVFVFILAFYLKDPIANWMSLNLPFFNFFGLFKGMTILNILMYQIIAFALIFSLLMALFGFIISFTGLFEKLLKMTIILAIPSKIGGFIVGLLEGYFLVFIGLFILSQPAFNINMLNEAKLKPIILEGTPIFGNVVKDTYNAVTDIYKLSEVYTVNGDKNFFERDVIDTLLKHDIVTVDYIESLIKVGKVTTTDIDEILDKYR